MSSLPSCPNRLLKAGPTLTALIKACLQPDPADRPTAAQLLAADYFQEFAAAAEEEEVLADCKRAAAAPAVAAPVRNPSPLCVKDAAGSCSAAEAPLSKTHVFPKGDSRWREPDQGRMAIKSILKVGQTSNLSEITPRTQLAVLQLAVQLAVVFNPVNWPPYVSTSLNLLRWL